MAIEIKELHIKAVVAENKNVPVAGSTGPKADLEKLKHEIIKECVQEVMVILENKMER